VVEPIDPAVLLELATVKTRLAEPTAAVLETPVRKLVVPPVIMALVPVKVVANYYLLIKLQLQLD
jgi:hypothetical protein